MEMYEEFSKAKASGEPHKCKFCHAEVWFHRLTKRWVDVGGKTNHSDNCELRKSHFSSEAKDKAELRRQARLSTL